MQTDRPLSDSLRRDVVEALTNAWRFGYFADRIAMKDELRAALATLQGLSPAQATDERAQFEAWERTLEGYPFARQFANLMWKAWQARAAIQAALPRGEEPPLPDAYYITDTEQGSTHWYTADQMREYRATPPLAPSVVAGEATDEHQRTLMALLECCEAWEPDVRVLGNVRAEDAAEAIRAYLATPPAAAGAAIPVLNALEVLGRMNMPHAEVINAAEFLRRLGAAGLWVIANPLAAAAPTAPSGD